MVVMGVKVHALTHRRYSPANDSLSLRPHEGRRNRSRQSTMQISS
jgi:hypothetical protein